MSCEEMEIVLSCCLSRAMYVGKFKSRSGFNSIVFVFYFYFFFFFFFFSNPPPSKFIEPKFSNPDLWILQILNGWIWTGFRYLKKLVLDLNIAMNFD